MDTLTIINDTLAVKLWMMIDSKDKTALYDNVWCLNKKRNNNE